MQSRFLLEKENKRPVSNKRSSPGPKSKLMPRALIQTFMVAVKAHLGLFFFGGGYLQKWTKKY